MLFGDFVQGSKFSYAGIGEDDIDFSFGRNDLVETIKVSQLANVSPNPNNVAADFFHSLVEFFLTSTCNENVGALIYEELCSSQSDPRCATRNHCYFSLKLLISGHRLSSLCCWPRRIASGHFVCARQHSSGC